MQNTLIAAVFMHLWIVVANDQYTLIAQSSHNYNSIDTNHKHTVIKQSLKVYAICNELFMQTCI